MELSSKQVKTLYQALCSQQNAKRLSTDIWKTKVLHVSSFCLNLTISVRKFSSVAQSCPTLWGPITNSWSLPKPMSIELVMPSSHLILCRPFSSCPQSLPASESFSMSQLFAWGGQSTGVSALVSFLPKKCQGWSPSELTGWISLQSKGLSRVFSNTTAQKHQFFCAQLSL